jgi:hypothetical protein
MEAFEHLVKVALEAENYVVTSNLKFFVKRKTKKTAYEEWQKHGYEIDLVGAKSGSLVLASVKSFLGSLGVNRQSFVGLADTQKKEDYGGYKIFNDLDLGSAIVEAAAQQFGYSASQVGLRLYVGKFKTGDEATIRAHLGGIHLGAGPVEVYGLNEIVRALLKIADSKTYINDPVVMTLKALRAAGVLHEDLVSSADVSLD